MWIGGVFGDLLSHKMRARTMAIGLGVATIIAILGDSVLARSKAFYDA